MLLSLKRRERGEEEEERERKGSFSQKNLRREVSDEECSHGVVWRHLHLEVEVDDRHVGQDGVGEHVPGIVHRALLGAAKELFDAHLGGNVLERLLLRVHVGPVALLCPRGGAML